MKILKANHQNLVGRLAELRAFYKTSLFVLVKEDLRHKQMLKHTNGFLAINNLSVVVAGDSFLTKNETNGASSGQVYLSNFDRKLRDKKIRPYVVINKGEYKGLKGKVIFADDTFVRVQLQATDNRVVLLKSDVTEIKDPTKPIDFGTVNSLDCNPTSFDDATKQDMGVNLLQMQQFGVGTMMYKPDAY